MSFLCSHFLFLGLFLSLGEVYLLVSLLLYCSEKEFIRFLLELIAVQLLYLFSLTVYF
jgi:hypothetical protein